MKYDMTALSNIPFPNKHHNIGLGLWVMQCTEVP